MPEECRQRGCLKKRSVRMEPEMEGRLVRIFLTKAESVGLRQLRRHQKWLGWPSFDTTHRQTSIEMELTLEPGEFAVDNAPWVQVPHPPQSRKVDHYDLVVRGMMMKSFVSGFYWLVMVKLSSTVGQR